jgi:hypothetical protein
MPAFLPKLFLAPVAWLACPRSRHAAATVIKLHGDYADLEMRNTIDELDTYPAEWNHLLNRIFDEYGLIVCGWSADWDRALVRALTGARTRRYPMYWDARSSGGSAAAQLIAQHKAVIGPATSADEFFLGLLERVSALEMLSESPITTAIAVSRPKRYLGNAARRIDLYDLVAEVTERVVSATAARPVHHPGLDAAFIDGILPEMLVDVTPVLSLLAAGAHHDRGCEHTHVSVECVHRLLRGPARFDGPFQDSLEHATRKVIWCDQTFGMYCTSFCPRKMITGGRTVGMNTEWPSYGTALQNHRLPFAQPPGEFIGDSQWTNEGPLTEVDFRKEAERADDEWPWWIVVGCPEHLENALSSLRVDLEKMRRW